MELRPRSGVALRLQAWLAAARAIGAAWLLAALVQLCSV